jgi:FPC/CPF motif-containing protein YcgG
VFENSMFETEQQFEDSLWNLLQTLHNIDTHSWDETTSSDPSSPKFSYSLLGTSFYIVGMHPNSSRWARSSPFPMIVFNLHSQFELLRSAGRYDRVRDLIRKRDKAYQGSINPMLEDFGTNSEARQYSGRAVESTWKCPFSPKT